MATEIYAVKTFAQIYEAMKKWLIGQTSNLNNFNEGSRLSVLLEAIAMVISQNNEDYYNGLKNAIPVSVYEGFGFSRLAGTVSAGTLVFTRSAPAGQVYNIGIGTAVILNGIQYATLQPGTIQIGQTASTPISSACAVTGVQGNVGIGSIDTTIGQGSFVNQPDGIEACNNDTAFVGGSDLESDDSRRSRFVAYTASFARSTVQGLISGALSVSGVKSASVVEFLPSIGWVTLYVDDGTGNLSPALLAEVTKVINGDILDPVNYPGYRGAGIQVSIKAPIIVTVNINITVNLLTSSLADDSVVQQEALNAIDSYVNALQLGRDVILSELVTVIQNSDTEVYDVIVNSPASNVSIPSDSVARTGTVTVTVARVSP